MKFEEIAMHRLQQQQLGVSNLHTATALVTWLGAVQAQEYSATKWGLGLRLPHKIDADIEDELSKGSILRTHVLRPTWHLVAAQDLRWLLQLTAPRVHAANAYMYKKEGLDASLFHKSADLLQKALEGGKQLSREELNAEFLRHNIKAEGHRLSYLMMHAELEGIICSGARRGNQFTYALLEERVPPAKAKDREEALAELTLRYFTSRGPAMLKDFATWSGLTLTDCKKGAALVGTALQSAQINGEAYYFSSLSTSLQPKTNKSLHLLPIYDELIMGYKDRSPLMIYREGLKSIPPFRFDSMILSHGQIVGTWKRSLHTKHIALSYAFFEPLTHDQTALFAKATQRLGQFYQLDVKMIEV